MRSSIGNSMLQVIVIVFVSLIILVFAGIMSYTKAYKAKNRIIEILEKYETYDENIQGILENDLHEMGYQLDSCKDPSWEGKENLNNGEATYKYCVYEIKNEESQTKYYKVITYTQFYFPIINNLFSGKVQGETKILGKTVR